MEINKRNSRLQFTDNEPQEQIPPSSPPTRSTFTVGSDHARVPPLSTDLPITPSRMRFAPDKPENPSLAKAQRKVDRAKDTLDQTKAKLPKQKRIAIARATDEITGKTITRLHFDEKIKAPTKFRPNSPSLIGREIHRQIDEAEVDNIGLQSAHGIEKGMERSVRLVKYSHHAQMSITYRKAEKAERAVDRATINMLQRKEPRPSNPYSRWQQKKAIRKHYMQAKAAGNMGYAQNTATSAFGVVEKAKQGMKAMFTRNKRSMALGGLLFFMMAMLMNGLSACTPLMQAGLEAIVIATYPAEDQDILAAERKYKEMEEELQHTIDRYGSDHPQYDEFIYEIDDIWHDPHALISLISARMNGEWTIDNVYGTLNILFENQYTLTQTVKSETRYREEWVKHHYKEIDPETGDITWVPYEVKEQVPYTYRICTVVLDNFNLSHLPFYVLSRKQVGMYAMYISVLGNREDLFRGNRYASVLKEPGEHDIPEEHLENETFKRLIEEAEKYIGYPYVWGGDSPETSFDCSGFVSYVFTNSGVRNVGRLGATSLYGACQKITPEEAMPGDLIFFEGTITGEDGITHVGLYVGDGYMIHCGNPIGYADLSASYWQKHYFGYGKLVNK